MDIRRLATAAVATIGACAHGEVLLRLPEAGADKQDPLPETGHGKPPEGKADAREIAAGRMDEAKDIRIAETDRGGEVQSWRALANGDMRVDKARPGEAFWAGVYSPVNRKGRGGVEPRTEKVGDGYAWYDVATWVPAPDEYLWIGPGRFNADGKSAINGVYVDKIRIVRVD